MANRTAGFYAHDTDTVYVTPGGAVFCVQTEDLVELPRRWPADADLSGFEPCSYGDFGPEMDAILREIEERTGETLLTEAE